METKVTNYLPLDEVLRSFHPDNPREHSAAEGGDVIDIAASLLEVGFATTLTMQEGGYLLSGHGRAQASDWLRQQSSDWFQHRWEQWLAKTPERKAIAHLHQGRFNKNYWNSVPVTMVELDSDTQKSTLIRLNNSQKDGKDNPKRMAALLSKLPPSQIEHSGWEPRTAGAFISAFIEKKKEQPEDNEDFQDKQQFQRPDATDKSLRPERVEGEDEDEDQNGMGYKSNFDDDEEDTSSQDSEWDEDGTRMAEVDEETGDFRADNVAYDTDIASSRAVLLMDDKMLERYKELAPVVAQKLGLDTTTESIKIWRPKCVLAAFEYIAAEGVKIEVKAE